VPPLKDELVGKKAIVLYVFFGYSCVSPLKDRSLGKKNPARVAFSLRFHHCSPLLLLRSHRCHEFFFDFFKLDPSLVMFGAFR
jgi:hypothetical protein